MAVESDVLMVRDACLRHFGEGDVNANDGLSREQFHAACVDLATLEGFSHFKELAEDDGLAAAVYSR